MSKIDSYIERLLQMNSDLNSLFSEIEKEVDNYSANVKMDAITTEMTRLRVLLNNIKKDPDNKEE